MKIVIIQRLLPHVIKGKKSIRKKIFFHIFGKHHQCYISKMKQLLVLYILFAGLCMITIARPEQDFDVGNDLIGEFLEIEF
jgi:hypothetical protein